MTPSVYALLVDTPLLPLARPSGERIVPVRPAGRDPARLDKTGRLLAAIQLLACASILSEFDLWPSRRAIRQARAVETPDGIAVVLGGWPLPSSLVHERLGGGEEALRRMRDGLLDAVAARTGVPRTSLNPAGGIDWLTYGPSLGRLLDEAPDPLPRAAARTLWAVRLELPELPEEGEVRYWSVPRAAISNRLGAAAMRAMTRSGRPAMFVDAGREGSLDGVEPRDGAIVVAGEPGARDLLTLERWVGEGRIDRAVVFGRFPVGWTPPAPVLFDEARAPARLVLAGLPRDRARSEAARRGRRFDPVSSEDRRSLTRAAAGRFVGRPSQREWTDTIDARLLEVLALDPDGVPAALASEISGVESGQLVRRAQALGAVKKGDGWRLSRPAVMRPGPLHARLAALLPEGSPRRLLHEVLGGGPADALGRWAREMLDDLRAGDVRRLLADTDPAGLPAAILHVWIEASLADLDLTAARRLMKLLPVPEARPWRAWLDVIEHPPGTPPSTVPPGAPLRVAAEVALRRLEVDRRRASGTREAWLADLERASRELGGILARRFEIESVLVTDPDRFTDRRWRRRVTQGREALRAVLLRRAAVILMDRGDERRAGRIFRCLAARESRPGPAGLLQLDLGWLALNRGASRTAETHHFRAYRLLEASGFRFRTRNVLFNLAVSDLDRLEVLRARKRFEASADPDDPLRLAEEARLQLAVGDEEAFRAALERLPLPPERGGLGLAEALSLLRGVALLLARRDRRAAAALASGGQEAGAWLDLLAALDGREGPGTPGEDGWGVQRCARLVRAIENGEPDEKMLGSPGLRSAFALALAERLLGRQDWVSAQWRTEGAGLLDGAGLAGWAERLRGPAPRRDGFLRAVRRIVEESNPGGLDGEETGALLAGAGVSGIEVRSRLNGRMLLRLGSGPEGEKVERGGLTIVPLGGNPGEHDGWALLTALIPLVVEVPATGSSVDAVTSGLYGESGAIKRLRADLRKLAPTRLPVAFLGETGVGKDVAAQALHRLSGRRGRFVAVNMAALPPHLIEAELFGSVRGAFTGAERSRRGLVVAADGGTLFLDEIGDLDLALQAKLLRFLESGEVRAVGADGTVAVDVRIVTATHRDLERRMREGRFRSDLYYRISSAVVHIPPLRERREDIPILRALFESQAINRDGVGAVRWSREAEDALMRYDWPGNVRELRHVVDAAMVRAMGGIVRVEDLGIGGGGEDATLMSGGYEEAMRTFRRRFLTEALHRHGGNRSATARELGISRQTLLYHIRMLGLTG